MEISFESNIDAWSRTLPEFAHRQVAYATSVALNDTAFELRGHHAGWSTKDFDRPTSWTTNALVVKKSNKRTQVVTVMSKEKHRRYLKTEIEGGVRNHTAWEIKLIHRGAMEADEYAMPGRGLKLNRYGNVPVGLYPKIIAQLKFGDSAIGDESGRSRKFRVAKKTAIFIPKITAGKYANRLPRGIWRRVGKRIEPLFIFVKAPPVYAGEYDFYGRAEEFSIHRFPLLFARSFNNAMATAK